MVADLSYLAALALAIAFVIAAVSKLANRSATAAAFIGLRVPRPALALRAVPFLEVVVAVLLVLAPAVGAPAALIMLAFFTTFLASRLREGIRVSCGCFGPSSGRPLSWIDVGRNVTLALVAFFAVTAVPHMPAPGALAIGVAATMAFAVGLTLLHRWAP